MNQPGIVLELNPSETNPRNSEGAFATLRDGSLLFVYSRYYGGGGDDDGAVLGVCTSHDGGSTWQVHEQPIVENEGRMNVMSVSFLRLPSGELLLFYIIKNSRHDCREHVRRSADDGKTWSDPTLCVPVPGYFVTNNDRVVQLRSGRILVPASLHETVKDGHRPGRLSVMISDDDAHTWRAVGPVEPPPDCASGLQEPGLVELADGRLWMHCRTDTGRHWQCFSNDQGETWSSAEPSEFQAPCSPLCIKRIPGSNDLLAVWNDHSGRFPIPDVTSEELHKKSWGRTPLATAISSDDGKTWQHHRAVESDFDHGYCYTAIHFVDDAVLLAYCSGGPEHGHVLCRLRIRRVPLASLRESGT